MNIMNNSSHRSGATLIEVLMALMIMSIGVVSVAALFPLAMKRALQATQLTNTQLLREQVLELLTYHPELIPVNDPTVNNTDPTTFSPSGNGFTTTSLFPSGGAVNAQLFAGGKSAPVCRIIDPLGVYETTAGYNFNGLTGVADNSARRAGPVTHPGPAGGDPLAAMEPVRRTNAGWTRLQALSRVPLHDSWVTDPVGVFIPTGPPTNNRTTLSYPDIPQIRNLMSDIRDRLSGDIRILVFDANNKNAQLRSIASIDDATRQITLDRPLPNNGSFNTVSQVRIQEFEQRYTWMLTTRTTLNGDGDDHRSGTADDETFTEIDLVIFFRRNYSVASETLQRMFFDKTQWAQQGSFRIKEEQREKPWIVIESTQPALVFDAGTFLFHPKIGKWFQIRDVLVDRLVTGADTSDEKFSGVLVGADVGKRLIQVQLSAFTPSDEEALNDQNVVQIMAPQGVVEVYKLPGITQGKKR